MGQFSPTYALSLTNADSFDFLFKKSSALLGYLFLTTQVMGRCSCEVKRLSIKIPLEGSGFGVFFFFFQS